MNDIKESPILFSTPMVKAILEGRKTETRRIIKMPKDYIGKEIFNNFPYGCKYESSEYGGTIQRCSYKGDLLPGDILWVKETFAKTGDNFHDDWPGHGDYYFRADDPYNEIELQQNYPGFKGVKWRPSLFMPKIACRIRLEVVSVGVSKLHTMTEDDAKNEGFNNITEFQRLWSKLNGDASLMMNPYVWVIKFKKI